MQQAAPSDGQRESTVESLPVGTTLVQRPKSTTPSKCRRRRARSHDQFADSYATLVDEGGSPVKPRIPSPAEAATWDHRALRRIDDGRSSEWPRGNGDAAAAEARRDELRADVARLEQQMQALSGQVELILKAVQPQT